MPGSTKAVASFHARDLARPSKTVLRLARAAVSTNCEAVAACVARQAATCVVPQFDQAAVRRRRDSAIWTAADRPSVAASTMLLVRPFAAARRAPTGVRTIVPAALTHSGPPLLAERHCDPVPAAQKCVAPLLALDPDSIARRAPLDRLAGVLRRGWTSTACEVPIAQAAVMFPPSGRAAWALAMRSTRPMWAVQDAGRLVRAVDWIGRRRTDPAPEAQMTEPEGAVLAIVSRL